MQAISPRSIIPHQLMLFSLLILLFNACQSDSSRHALVFQSDFGLKDGAVAAMRGVAIGVSPQLQIHDLTHEIPAYDVWEAAYRLEQTAPYWPAGTVFVSVVDPGVGTDRKSVVLQTNTGHYFVTPDNGTLTLVAASMGIKSLREIDEAVNRRKDSEQSYTFHGRDVYAFTGARLAAGKIRFEDVGKELPAEVISIEYQEAVLEEELIKGNIPVLDVQYGNIWTNIPRTLVERMGMKKSGTYQVQIFDLDQQVYQGAVPFVNTFGDVKLGKPLLYLNSLNNLALAINQGNAAKTFGLHSGARWSIWISRVKKY